MVETAPVYVVEGPIGGGTGLVKSCCALGCMVSCRSRSRGVAQVTICGDVGRVYVYGFRTGRDLAASEIRHDSCQSIEIEAHGVKRGLKWVR